MAVAKNDKELFNLLKREVGNKLSNEIAIDLRSLYRQTIQNVVYGVYSPKQYKRRYSLIANVFSLYSSTKSSLEVSTKAFANMSNGNYGTVYDLLGLIEYGQGNNQYGDEYNMWNGSDAYGRARPFNRISYEKANKINYNKYFK